MTSVTHNIAAMLVAAGVAAGCDGDPTSTIDAMRVPCMDASHDEDGDAIGDGCDICPTIVDPLQHDLGEASLAFPDGVGDICDPRPNIAGDRRVALHTFAAADAGLRDTNWTIADDQATAADGASFESVKRHVGDGLIAQVRLAAVTGVELMLDGTAGCSLASTGELVAFERGGEMARTTVPLATTVTLTAFRAIARDRSAAILCRVFTDDTPRTTVEIRAPLADDLTSGNYVLSAAAGTVATSLVVYTTPLLPQDMP